MRAFLAANIFPMMKDLLLDQRKKDYLILNTYFNLKQNEEIHNKRITLGELLDSDKYYTNKFTSSFTKNILYDIFDITREKQNKAYRIPCVQTELLNVLIRSYQYSAFKNTLGRIEIIKKMIEPEIIVVVEDKKYIFEELQKKLTFFKDNLSGNDIRQNLHDIQTKSKKAHISEKLINEYKDFYEFFIDRCCDLKLYPRKYLPDFLTPIKNVRLSKKTKLIDFLLEIENQFTYENYVTNRVQRKLNEKSNAELKKINKGIDSNYKSLNKEFHIYENQLRSFFSNVTKHCKDRSFCIAEEYVYERLMNSQTIVDTYKIFQQYEEFEILKKMLPSIYHIVKVPNILSRDIYLKMICNYVHWMYTSEDSYKYDTVLEKLKFQTEDEALAYVPQYTRHYNWSEKIETDIEKFLNYIVTSYYPILEACFYVIANLSFGKSTLAMSHDYTEKHSSKLLLPPGTLVFNNYDDVGRKMMVDFYELIRNNCFNSESLNEWQTSIDINYLSPSYISKIIDNVILQKSMNV